MNRKTLICIAVIIATVFPVCIYCFQIPLGKLLVPDIMYSTNLSERFVVIHGTIPAKISVGVVIQRTI